MNGPVRYALAGMIGLALLSGNQWARGHAAAFGPIVRYLLGVLPNFAAAVAMPLILAGILATGRDGRAVPLAPRKFLALAAFTCTGLLAWEFLQLAMPPFRFDWDDIAATLLGTLAAWGFYRLVRPEDG